MTITALQENTGAPVLAGPITSTTISPSSVTSGSLFTIGFAIYAVPELTPTSGMLTKTAGTSTIGTVALDVYQRTETNTEFTVAIYSFLVTGSGSLTLTWNGGQSGSYLFAGYGEYSHSGGWDSGRLEDTSSGANYNTSPSSGSVSSVGEALFFAMFTDARDATITTTPDASFVEIAQEEGVANMVGSTLRRIATGALTDSADWTLSLLKHWTAAIAVYKGASATQSQAPRSMHQFQMR